MTKDHEQRIKDLVNWGDISFSLIKKVEERDKVKNIDILEKGKKKVNYTNKWISDKKGVTVNRRVITPILKFLRDIK